jgi:hypothetical protein
MSMSVGASSSSALSYLQQLLQQGTAGASNAASGSDPLSMLMQEISGDGSSTGQTSTAAASTTASGSSAPPFGQDMMSQLISLQSQQTGSSGTPSPAQAFFSKLDSDGDGKISQSEFETAATKAGASKDLADAVFAKIDGNSDGSVSQSELTKADHGGGHHHHHHVEGGGGSGGSSSAQGSGGSGQSALDALMSATGADGATTQSATNADGSTTTTISYADGSKIDMTSPAASSNSGTTSGSTTNNSTSNLLEQLIKLQSQVLSVSTSTMSAFA